MQLGISMRKLCPYEAMAFQLTLMQGANKNGALRNIYFQAFFKKFLEGG